MKGVYGDQPLSDAVRIARAVLTNILARASPRTYVRYTGETGRGRAVLAPHDTALYFLECVHEYMDVLGVPRHRTEFWLGKRVIEYGPGDLPGVGLLLAGFGAQSVLCVDRFPLVQFGDHQLKTISAIASVLPDDECRRRMWSCFVDPRDPDAALGVGPLQYSVSRCGLVGGRAKADIVLSRAVLEHVHDLSAIFRDIAHSLGPNGISVHKVDLKSHGLHRHHRLDFLTWPEALWRVMFSHKGAPNRLRVDSYRAAALAANLVVERLDPCEVADASEVQQIRSYLARPFRELSEQDLSWLSFWISVRGRVSQ